MPLNRLVAFVLGPIITLASGYISLFAAKNIPGLHLTQKGVAGALTLAAITIAPMILSHLKVQKWLEGWQKWEQRTDNATNGALSRDMQAFMERLAAKTGVPLPDGSVIEGETGEPVQETPTGPPQPPANVGADSQETGDIFTPPAGE